MTLLAHQYFTQSALLYPKKCAVSCDSERITYEEMENFTNGFARYLQKAGISRGAFIPFFMKKGINSIKAILGILKADCAYIPIDVNSPEQRLKSILSSSESQLVIADSTSQARLQELLKNSNIKIINIDNFTDEDIEKNCSPIKYQNLSIDLAYVLFTSGSTGTPKGVMIPHKAITDYIDWCVDTYAISDSDNISNHAPLYFDNSTFDLYTAFKSGATLHLVPDELNAVIPRLVKWLNEKRISIFFCVPSVPTMLLKSRRLKEDSFPDLKHLICAGEVLSPRVLSELSQLYPHVQLTNMYGPTEITVDCSYYIAHKDNLPTANVPIGKARKNMELFVRQESGELSQKEGAKGELLVRGTSVAYGYLGEPEKTSKVFIQNPNNTYFYDPLYCTGDRVEIDKDSNFLFLGRADDQIKFLGYRIELGEIETNLNATESVDEAIVVFNNSDEEQFREIGALVRLKENFSLEQLNTEVKARLPSYMLPTRIMEVSGNFPQTPNGKYDRRKSLELVFEL